MTIGFQENSSNQIIGSLSAPATPKVDGFFRLVQFLDEGDFLRPGQGINAALQRCGIVTTDQLGIRYGFRPHGLFQDGVVTEKAKELLDILAEEGFTGSVFHMKDGYEHESFLQDGVCTDHRVEQLRAYG